MKHNHNCYSHSSINILTSFPFSTINFLSYTTIRPSHIHWQTKFSQETSNDSYLLEVHGHIYQRSTSQVPDILKCHIIPTSKTGFGAHCTGNILTYIHKLSEVHKDEWNQTFATSTSLNFEYKESRRLLNDFKLVLYSFNLHYQKKKKIFQTLI